jgi:hypothetical protein
VSDLPESLANFATYVQTHLPVDEKGEFADFLHLFFLALGHDGIKEAGVSRATRVKKSRSLGEKRPLRQRYDAPNPKSLAPHQADPYH